MVQQFSGRGSWFRAYLLSKHGKRAVQELNEQRVRQEAMPPCDEDMVYTGPEFDFNDCATSQSQRNP